jgi:hypothetical protein
MKLDVKQFDISITAISNSQNVRGFSRSMPQEGGQGKRFNPETEEVLPFLCIKLEITE